MRRGLDDEGLGGPFALKDISGSNSKSSHTVAFEDRGDATNFCYILQSFFEDLPDFSAEIVPLSIKVYTYHKLMWLNYLLSFFPVSFFFPDSAACRK